MSVKNVALLGLLVVFCSLAVNASTNNKELNGVFAKWMRDHKKIYSNEEFLDRYNVWVSNYNYIKNHNEKRNATFTLAMNKFADLTNQEFNKLYKGLKLSPEALQARRPQAVPKPTTDIPTSFDWRKQGAVTEVKNQGQCGSCWSFSATGSTEGVHFLKTKQLVSLSEQNLVDCSTAQGNQGCNGGLMDQAFQYIITNGGVDTEASYPYTAQDGNCHFDKNNVGATLTSFTDIPSGDEKALLNANVICPVSVAIDASASSFQFYSGGVYYEPDCSSTQLDHGVLAVGWGVDDSGTEYWLVKNSWGADWGLNGYIWMSRNKDNNCGIATAASYPVA